MIELKYQVKELLIDALMIEDLTPDDINSDSPLFGGDLDIDSVDVLEIVVELERVFGVNVPEGRENRHIFYSVSTIASFIASHQVAIT